MKIQAMVDGKMTITKYQGGHENSKSAMAAAPSIPRSLKSLRRFRVTAGSKRENASNALSALKGPRDRSVVDQADSNASAPSVARCHP